MDLPEIVNGPGRRAVAEADQRLIDATNADNECEHRNLPADPNPTCDCWDRCSCGSFRRYCKENFTPAEGQSEDRAA